MKTSHSRMGGKRALTRVEVVVIILVTLVAVGFLLPILANLKPKASRQACTGNLMQIGLAFRIFPPGASDAYPMQLSTNRGGSGEFALSSEVFRHFQALSNELGTPKILVCPADRRKSAPNFLALANSNISYFIGLNAQEFLPDVVLSGDSNLTTNEVPTCRVAATYGSGSALRKYCAPERRAVRFMGRSIHNTAFGRPRHRA